MRSAYWIKRISHSMTLFPRIFLFIHIYTHRYTYTHTHTYAHTHIHSKLWIRYHNEFVCWIFYVLSNFCFIYNSWSCHIPLNTLGISSKRIFTSKCLISIYFSIPFFSYSISATKIDIYVSLLSVYVFLLPSKTLGESYRFSSYSCRLCGLCETGFCGV